MRKKAIAALVLVLAVLTGCGGHAGMAKPDIIGAVSDTAMDVSPGPSNATISYLGFSFAPSVVALPTEEGLYSTGETYNGKRIYVSSKVSAPEKVPHVIFIKNDNISYSSYALTNVPPVYAYALFGAFGPGEPVAFGLVNDHGGHKELTNAAPWTIQRNENGQWKTVHSPAAAMVITPLENGSQKEWTWDQKLDDGTQAPNGDYRARFDDGYTAGFKISDSSAAVYKKDTIDEGLVCKIVQKPSGMTYSRALRDEIDSEMLFKAWMRGLDAPGLRSAMNATGTRDEKALPTTAIRALSGGTPVWMITFNWGTTPESLTHTKYYIVDDKGRILAGQSCL